MSLTDKIFGRQSLKERISFLQERVEGLEKEKEELRIKADKEQNRAKEAITRKQQLDREIKKKQDRIESLQDEIKKKEFLSSTSISDKKTDEVPRERLGSILEKIGSIESKDDDLFTVFLPKETSVEDLDAEGLIQTNLTLNQLRRLKEESSETGKVLFHCEDLFSLLLKPPVPVRKDSWKKGKKFETDRLQELIEQDVGFVYLSAGGSSAALFSREIKDMEIVRSSIKGKHKKGGFSQGRFERGRMEEVKKHVEKVVDAAKKVIPEDVEVSVCGSEDLVALFEDSDFADERRTFRRNIDISGIETKNDLQRAFSRFWKASITYL